MTRRKSSASQFAIGIFAVGLLAVGLAAGCAGQILHAPTEADALAAGLRWPGTTVTDLQHGRQLYTEHCSSCHALYRPEQYPAEKWRGFVEEMIVRARLQRRDADDVIRYLVVTAEQRPGAHTPVAASDSATHATR